MSRPYCCPVCLGKGVMPSRFYRTPSQWTTSDGGIPVGCRSCGGRGIVWSAEPDSAGWSAIKENG